MGKARWIWHYGDYEIYHSLLLHARRQERGADYPVMWRTDTPWATVEFLKSFENEKEETLRAKTNGIGYVMLDGVRYPMDTQIPVAPGKHAAVLRVTKTDGLPCVYVESGSAPSDESWEVTHLTAQRVPAGGTPVYTDPEITPEVFLFAYERIVPVQEKKAQGGILYDFGRETFAKVNITGARPEQAIHVYYGESETEALDTEDCILRERVSGSGEYTLVARAFRYLYVTGGEGAGISADYEYLPLEYKGSFSCDRETINQVWEMAAYTFHLNSREFFLDGIKRDRWVWSGDAFQSYMIQNYLFFDQEIVKRTIIALRGKEPVEQHINTILDYSFYWIISLHRYYMTFGDSEFVRRMYPKMESLLVFCERSLDENGFVTGRPEDWIFIDWSDMDKEGAVCAEQMLYLQSLRSMSEITKLLYGSDEGYADKAEQLKEKIQRFYWREEKGAYIDSYTSGRENVTRHANIFAVMFGIADTAQTRAIVSNVLLNDSVTQITTPYFKFFELDVLCSLGYLETATQRMEDYWGGMLQLGATTVWEQYDPAETGTEHYAMYGMKYGRSLCHAWGAGPVYLLGRYYLGVAPVTPGYRTFEVAPQLGGLMRISGTVPVNNGTVRIDYDGITIRVLSDKEGGILKIWGNEYPIKKNEELVLTK